MAIDKRSNEDEIKFITGHYKFLPKGTKEACIILRRVINGGDINRLSNDEIDAIRCLVSAAYDKPDEVPTMYYCDNDCCHSSDTLCVGEMYINQSAKVLCPNFIG